MKIEINITECKRIAAQLGRKSNTTFQKLVYGALNLPLTEQGLIQRYLIRFGTKYPVNSRLRQLFDALEDEVSIIEASGMATREVAEDARQQFIQQYKNSGVRFDLVCAIVYAQSTATKIEIDTVEDEDEPKVNGNRGRSKPPRTPEHRANNGASIRGKTKGMLFWNNGVVCKRSKTQPGPEWVQGMIKRSSASNDQDEVHEKLEALQDRVDALQEQFDVNAAYLEELLRMKHEWEQLLDLALDLADR